MSDASRKIISGLDIFADRRQLNGKLQQNTVPCRRQNNFSKTETAAWWLKVNYVKQHLRSVGDHKPTLAGVERL